MWTKYGPCPEEDQKWMSACITFIQNVLSILRAVEAEQEDIT